MGQLHGFWYFEAERTFRQVVKIDPDCAMAYWGMTLANVNNRERAAKLIAEAVERKDSATPREQAWIGAWEAFYKDPKADEKKRLRALVRALEQISWDHPDDIEAKAFVVQQTWRNDAYHGIKITSHLAVDALIREILAVQPNHPCHHYRIHLWDNEKAERALHASANCGEAAPNIAHMWHMPGHIYSKLKRYDDAAWHQEASARVDHRHMIRTQILPDQIHNFAHNNQWLVGNLNRLGRVRDALDLAANMVSLPRLAAKKPEPDTLDKPAAFRTNKYGSASYTYGQKKLAEILVAWELWDELAAATESPLLEGEGDSTREMRRHYLRALAAAELEQDSVYKTQRSSLEALRQKVEKEQEKALAEARKKAEEGKETDRKKREDALKKAEEGARKPFKKRLQDSQRQLDELALVHGLKADEPDTEKLLELLGKVKHLPRERRARWHVALGEKDQATTLLVEAIDKAPNELLPIATAADLYAQMGEDKKYAEQVTALKGVGFSCDLDLPVLQGIPGLEGDWRLPHQPKEDIAAHRPDLDSLGPFRWSPPPAPEWSLRDAEEKEFGSSALAGQPHILIFFLGNRCEHCIQQLDQFAPLAEEFEKAGLPIVTVSTDGPDGVARTLWAPDGREDEDGERRPYPFPLLSDSEERFFRAFRAYDSFEDQALHGTFVIDGAGHIRWSDISYEPFNKPGFLLREARRLLGLDEEGPTP